MAGNFDDWDPMSDAFYKHRKLMGHGTMSEQVSFAKTKGDIVLYVRGVNTQCSRTALINLFSKTGKVIKCVFGSKRSDVSTRTAYIGYKTQIEAEKAIEEFDEFMFGGYKLYVTVALTEAEKQERRAKQMTSLYTGIPEDSVNVMHSPWANIGSRQQRPSKESYWGPEDDFCDDVVEGQMKRTLSEDAVERSESVNLSSGRFDSRWQGAVKVGCLTQLFVIAELFRSPTSFPCHTKHPNEIRIHERYCQRQLNKNQDLKSGYKVAALYNGEYYRAEIINPVQPGADVLVYFTDYGNESLISQSELHILDANDQVRPSSLIQVCIEGSDESMTEEYADKFMKLATKEGMIKIGGMIVKYNEETKLYTLRMGNLSYRNEETSKSSQSDSSAVQSSSADSSLASSLESNATDNSINNSGDRDSEKLTSAVDSSLFEFSSYLRKDTIATVITASQTNLCVVRPEHLKEQLQSIDELVNLYVSSANPVDSVEEGDIVIAPFGDMFYRGLVKSVEMELALIFFIDYGDEFWIPTSRLKSFSEDGAEIAALCPLAFPCRVAGIAGKHDGKFSEDSFRMMAKIVSNSCVTVRGISVVHDDVFGGDVLLVKMSTESVPCVASHLIEKKAVSKLVEDAAEKKFPYLKDIGCNPSLKASNEWMDVIPLYYESATNFTVTDEDGVDSISQMADELKEAYDNRRDELSFDKNNQGCKSRSQNISKGMAIVAFSMRYETYFRSCVCCIYHEEQAADVLFFDFGDVEKIPFCNLFRMEDKFIKKRQLSITCCLEDNSMTDYSLELEHKMSDMFISENSAMKKMKIKIFGRKVSDDCCEPVKAIVAMKMEGMWRSMK